MSFALPHKISFRSPIRSAPLRENFDAIEAALNGGLDAESLGDAVIEARHLCLKVVGNANVADSAIGALQLDPALKAFYMKGIDALAYNDYDPSQGFREIRKDGTGFFTFTVNPAVDSIMYVTGNVTMYQDDDETLPAVTHALHTVALMDAANTIRLQGCVWAELGVGNYNTIPVCGFLELQANTTYTYTLKLKSSARGEISQVGSEGRTQIAGFLLPKGDA